MPATMTMDFVTILRQYDEAPWRGRVKLVRHADSRWDLRRVVRAGMLREYEARQSRPIFHHCDYVVSFLGERGTHRGETTDVETLRCLHEQAAVWEEAGARLKLAQEEVVRIAEFRIRIERKMGEQLAQTVHRGGHGSNSHSASSKSGGSSAPLPSGINWSASWRYRRLATIREDRFEEYLALARAQLRVPSARGVVVFAAEARTENAPREARKPRSVKATVPLSKNLTDAVQRLLTVDVCVGGRSRLMVAARTVGADLIHVKQLEGAVFVAECPDPRAWLAALAAARTRGRVAEAVVVLPAATAEPWFKLLDEGGWSCCFVRGSTTVVAYHGKRTHGFRLAFSELGAVLHGGGSGGVGSRE